MGTTTEKLNAILESKEKIRQAINYKGIPVPDSTKFSEYANKIEEIKTTQEKINKQLNKNENNKKEIEKVLAKEKEEEPRWASSHIHTERFSYLHACWYYRWYYRRLYLCGLRKEQYRA